MTIPTLPAIFDRNRLRARRDRMATIANALPDDDANFLAPLFADRLEERLEDIDREAETLLLIGGQQPEFQERLQAKGFAVTLIDPGSAFAEAGGGIMCDEDALLSAGLTPASFDIILWNGGLDTVNDVPGALIQCRKLLKPNGVLIGVSMGAGSLATLRNSLRALASEQGIARFHPQIDVRAMGDLLQRCGFILPMADHEELTVRYSGLERLIADLRASGLTNCLSGSVPPLSRASYAALTDNFAKSADPQGRISEKFTLLYFTGWAPPSIPSV